MICLSSIFDDRFKCIFFITIHVRPNIHESAKVKCYGYDRNIRQFPIIPISLVSFISLFCCCWNFCFCLCWNLKFASIYVFSILIRSRRELYAIDNLFSLLCEFSCCWSSFFFNFLLRNHMKRWKWRTREREQMYMTLYLIRNDILCRFRRLDRFKSD